MERASDGEVVLVGSGRGANGADAAIELVDEIGSWGKGESLVLAYGVFCVASDVGPALSVGEKVAVDARKGTYRGETEVRDFCN